MTNKLALLAYWSVRQKLNRDNSVQLLRSIRGLKPLQFTSYIQASPAPCWPPPAGQQSKPGYRPEIAACRRLSSRQLPWLRQWSQMTSAEDKSIFIKQRVWQCVWKALKPWSTHRAATAVRQTPPLKRDGNCKRLFDVTSHWRVLLLIDASCYFVKLLIRFVHLSTEHTRKLWRFVYKKR